MKQINPYQKSESSNTYNYNEVPKTESKRIIAGIFAILLGGLGIHKFILNYNTEGIIMLLGSLLFSFFTCGISAAIMGTIGLIEGIIYLTKSDEDFYTTYQLNHKGWF